MDSSQFSLLCNRQGEQGAEQAFTPVSSHDVDFIALDLIREHQFVLLTWAG